MEALALEGAFTYLCQILAVWGIGLVLGWLLPKPRWVDRSLKAKAVLLATPPGLWARRVAIAAHLYVIIREVWRNLFAPGTFRGVLRNAWLTLTTGACFQWPLPLSLDVGAGPLAAADVGAAPADSQPAADSWYVTAKDLAHFKWIVCENGTPDGASAWEPMMEKQWPGCKYTAWRRTLASGKAEYKSVTISENATAEEFNDFYLDDDTRQKWDGMITEAQLLETGDRASRQQVIRWLRTFPFSFVSQREYVIARRLFREADGSLSVVTKVLNDHPAAPRVPGQVRMENFVSSWRSRTVPCPFGSGRPAVETTLLHFEDFQINERLARFAVRHGMAGFMKGMLPAVRCFVAERRSRCDPFAEDPDSFGCRQLAPASLTASRSASLTSTLSCATGPSAVSQLTQSGVSCAHLASDASMDDSASDRSAGASVDGLPRSSSMRRLGAMMLASGVAIALAHTASTSNLPRASASAGGHATKQRHSDSNGHHVGRHTRRHGGGSGGSGHAHGSSHRRRSMSEKPPRPRRRQQAAAAAGQPAAVEGC